MSERKYTLQQVITAAKANLKGVPLCVDALKGISSDRMFSLEELNDLSETLVLDSKYWNL